MGLKTWGLGIAVVALGLGFAPACDDADEGSCAVDLADGGWTGGHPDGRECPGQPDGCTYYPVLVFSDDGTFTWEKYEPYREGTYTCEGTTLTLESDDGDVSEHEIVTHGASEWIEIGGDNYYQGEGTGQPV